MNVDGLTIKDLVNRYLTSKKLLVDGGELAPRTWRDYHACCGRLVDLLGGGRSVVDLAADDFEHLRAVLGATMGPAWLKVEMQRVRSVFKYGYDAGLIDRPVRFGAMFKSPSNRVIQKKRRGNGPRMFEADEIRKMLGEAKPLPKAMILLRINRGFGNNDCALLRKSALDLEGGWIDFPRPKTEVPRRCPLWLGEDSEDRRRMITGGTRSFRQGPYGRTTMKYASRSSPKVSRTFRPLTMKRRC